MTDYTGQAPGVYVEQVPSGTIPIAGVGTSVAGFVGVTPDTIYYDAGSTMPTGPFSMASAGTVVPVTNFTEFKNAFGDVSTDAGQGTLAQAVYGFFNNGGTRCYVTRISTTPSGTPTATTGVTVSGIAPVPTLTGVAVTGATVTGVTITGATITGGTATGGTANTTSETITGGTLTGGTLGGTLTITAGTLTAGTGTVSGIDVAVLGAIVTGPAGPITGGNLTAGSVTGGTFTAGSYTGGTLSGGTYTGGVTTGGTFTAAAGSVGASISGGTTTGVTITGATLTGVTISGGTIVGATLTGGTLSGGNMPTVDWTTDITAALALFEPLDDISIVAAPGLSGSVPQGNLRDHCEKMLTRFAILDTAPQMTTYTTTLGVAGGAGLPIFTSSFAALYFPWIQVYDAAYKLANRDPYGNLLPASATPSVGLRFVPPSGHMAGIYARVDTQRGVNKAPANEGIRGALDLEFPISQAQQGALNELNVNCLRRLNGSLLVWGARTLSATTDFRYVNVRRLFNYLRGSIEQGTQWAVFEPNNADLWARITRNVTAFLQTVWTSGGLVGDTAGQAFYVLCNAETNPPSVQNLGQVVTEIGVAITRPAEYVVFRMGQTLGS